MNVCMGDGGGGGGGGGGQPLSLVSLRGITPLGLCLSE